MNKLLTAVVVLGFLLRVFLLTSHPAGFTPDEASFGYDAYSLFETGRDQWGNVLPMTLKSFGDYKMALYSYLAMPSVAIFGLNEFATRLPNAILGTLAIISTYYLALLLFKDKRVAMLSALLLSISPWHVSMSRGAFEANLTTFFLTTGLVFLEMGKQKRQYLLLSALFLGLNLFTYHAARIVTPLVLLYFVFRDRKGFSIGKYTALSLFVFLSFLVLAGYSYLSGAGSRATTAGIFSLANQVADDRYDAVLVGLPDYISRIFNNKITHLSAIFTSNYSLYLSPQFFFTHGPAEGTYGMLPGSGVLYYYEAIFLIGFLWAIFSRKVEKVDWLLVWLIVAPIPAALTIGPGYAANRAVVMIPAIQIASAVGGVFLYDKLVFRWKAMGKVSIYGFLAVSFVYLAFFVEDYYFQQPAKQANAMIYGAREAVLRTHDNEGEVRNIIFSKKISEPHIYVAFYNHVPPHEMQQASKQWNYEKLGYDWVDQIPEYTLGVYTFKLLDWHTDSKKENTILVGRPEEFPYDYTPSEIIKYPDGSEAYWIVNLSSP